ncbi:MAG: TPM domain-containing protein [Desulfobulbaceae bacterium]|jgi:uncharacterized protein|nr:TPM domain-containing protein [Desulfobulbaceae bacterium]
MKTIVLTLAAFFLAAQMVFAATASAETVAPATGHINDRAGMLDATTAQRLETYLSDFEKSDSTQIAVLTVPTLGGQSLEEFSLAVATSWGLGQKGKDNGALLIIARDERRIRIEVGYGLEGRLTDLTAGHIIRGVITPAFRQGDFAGGISRGVEAMVAAIKGEYQAQGSGGKEDYTDTAASFIALLIISGIIGRTFGSHKPLAGLVGGGVVFCLGQTVFGIVGTFLLLITAVGAIVSFLIAALGPLPVGNFSGPRGGSGRPGGFGGGFGGLGCFGGGFGGGGGGGFGGFGGGGGGFGGGGASGGW